MANYIVQSLYGNTSLNHKDVMTALQAAKEVISDSPRKVESINDLDLDDRAKIAAGCYEDIQREDISEILARDLNSDFNSLVIKFLSDDDLDNRDDLCDAIKRAFTVYFHDRISEAVEQAIQDRIDSKKYYDYNEDEMDADIYGL